MDEEIERLVVSVRADTRGFAADVAEMRGALDGPLAAGVGRAGRAIETSLSRAIRTGQLGFDDLRRSALAVLGEIADAALSSGLEALFGGGARGGGGLGGALIGLIAGAPGRATGGPVSPARPYWVGERGPELFVPTASGTVMPTGSAGPREVRVAITVNAGVGMDGPRALERSSRQVARAVRAALEG
ncbi:tail tape measure protein [Sphingomonas sp. BGYR3]|uniref:tail tape measure protein n=1 Tax=Sphingomonas sp. BGYR3 TaxID=2975483 RepID=UPI0021A3F488|nr:tail tape measure protein [Sphingomonas sp. BGYR3]MDG5489132.1 tail tape measure protein [Sphingomonas sp. BGYR3]